MKILMINPPYTCDCCAIETEGPYSHTPVPSMGLAYIVAFLHKYGCSNVRWVEAPLQEIGIDEIRGNILEEKPDVVGITSSTFTFKAALKVAEIAKELDKETKVIMGGPHVTFNTENVLSSDAVDIIVRGEGELTTLDLIRKLENQEDLDSVEGLAFKRGKQIVYTAPRQPIQDLDDLPFPAWHLLPKEAFEKSEVAIITSRGCVYRCIFCASKSFWGEQVRYRSVQNILEELEILVWKYKRKRIDFFDDTFTINKRRVKELCKGIKESGLDFSWTCNARIDTVSQEILKTMKEAGCYNIFFGIESGSQRILNICRKGLDVQKIKRAVNLAKELDYIVTLSFVLGLPGESWESVNETIELIKDLRVDLNSGDQILINPLIPLPGTEIYENPGEFGIKILDIEWKDYVQFLAETKDLSVSDLKKAFFDIMDVLSLKMLDE